MLDRLDERNEGLRTEDRLDDYISKLEFYGKPDSSEEFNIKVELQGAELRKQGIIPEVQSLTREELEKTLDERYESKLNTIQQALIDGKTLDEASRMVDMGEYSLGVAIEDLKVKISPNMSIPMESAIAQNGFLYDRFNIERIEDGKAKAIDYSETTLYDLIGGKKEIIHINRDEYVEKHGHWDVALREKYNEKFSNIRDTKPEKLEGRFEEKLFSIYKEKGINDPTLAYGLRAMVDKNYYNLQMDSVSRIAVSEYIKSLSVSEKIQLIPQTKRESDTLSSTYGLYKDDILRPITGYANINAEMMDRMSDYLKDKKCLEIMSGNGLLSSQLQQRGVDIIATEKYNPKDNGYIPLKNQEAFCDVKYIDALDAIKEYGKDIDILVMSWPPYGNEIASQSAELLHDINPSAQILYIGEFSGGCTADDRFFNITEQVLDIDVEKIDSAHTQIFGLHDYITLMNIDPELEKMYDEY